MQLQLPQTYHAYWENVLSHAEANVLTSLQGLLPLAVGQRIEVVGGYGWDWRLERLDQIRERWHKDGHDAFSEALLFRTRRGESKQAFIDLAEVLAIMAFVPGGVRAFGLHWEAHD